MSQIINILFRKLNTYIGLIAIIIFALILIMLSVWCYYYYAKPLLSDDAINQRNIPNNGSNEEVTFYFFNVDWCPHCIKAKPEWIKFCQKYDGKEYNGYIISCVGGENGTDCTNSDDPSVIDIIQKFNIEHYPTLKMVKGSSVVDFDGKITDDNLETFIVTILQK
jgi:thiol-disulfide isomerase/thioredoxin